jgi:hypothetical protein
MASDHSIEDAASLQFGPGMSYYSLCVSQCQCVRVLCVCVCVLCVGNAILRVAEEGHCFVNRTSHSLLFSVI